MSNAHILAIDDDPHLLASVKRCLKRSDFDVTTATSGKAALRLAQDHPPDLILLDVSMPLMSGHDFLRRLRRLETKLALSRSSLAHRSRPAHPIPVIFLTGLTRPDQYKTGIDAGAVDYIGKPFEPEDLRARIRGHLRTARAQESVLDWAETTLFRSEMELTDSRNNARVCVDLLDATIASVELVTQEQEPHLREVLLQSVVHDLREIQRTMQRTTEQRQRCEELN